MFWWDLKNAVDKQMPSNINNLKKCKDEWVTISPKPLYCFPPDYFLVITIQ